MRKEKIVIIDDSPMMQKILEHILTPYYVVFSLSEYLDIVDSVKTIMPSLILLDIIMPKISGFEIIQLLKNDPETVDIPVIFLTGLEGEETEEKGLGLGAVDYIKKPFRPNIVLARVRTHIKLYLYQKKIESLTLVDGLTDIPNRRAYDICIQNEWEHHLAEGQYLSLLLMDIDFFKLYNDTYGHLSGDRVLYIVAQTIQDTVEGADHMAARYGGEEFAVLLHHTGEVQCRQIAEKVLCEIRDKDILHQASTVVPYVTVSIGAVTAIPKCCISMEAFVKQADESLYEAKNAGRNRYCWKRIE